MIDIIGLILMILFSGAYWKQTLTARLIAQPAHRQTH